MTRLTAPRISSRYYGETARPVLVPCKIKAGATVFAGGMVAMTATGEVVSAADAAASYGLGRSDNTYRNTGNAATDGEYRRGVFNWKNDGSISQANVGQKAGIVDDQTVKAFADGDKFAGIILFIDEYGIWVESSPEIALILSQTVTAP